jgi:hypothetical protein
MPNARQLVELGASQVPGGKAETGVRRLSFRRLTLVVASMAVLALIDTGRAAAGVLNVCPSGCPYSGIQGAAGTYQGGLEFDKEGPLTLVGAGAGQTTISGVYPQPYLRTGSVIHNDYGSTEIKSVAITGGTGNGPYSCVGCWGGGITNQGTLILDDSRVSGNVASFRGGGILNVGTFTLNNSTVSGNTAPFAGGIENVGQGATLRLNDSTISGNTAKFTADGLGGDGGGIEASYSTVTINGSTVSGNTAADSGGGIAVLNYATATLANSKVRGNTAANDGGGILISGGTLTLSNSTVTGNTPDNIFNTG